MREYHATMLTYDKLRSRPYPQLYKVHIQAGQTMGFP